MFEYIQFIYQIWMNGFKKLAQIDTLLETIFCVS
jgi:hypothetical protein